MGPSVILRGDGRDISSLDAIRQPGGFVVTWTDYPAPASPAIALFFQRFDLELQPLGPVVTVEAVDHLYRQRPALAAWDDDGSFTLGWVSRFGPNGTVRVGRFSAQGTALSPAISVADAALPNAANPNADVSLAIGPATYAVGWVRRQGDSGASSDAWVRVMSQDGSPQGPELLLGPGFPRVVSITGGFLAVRLINTGLKPAIYARQLTLDGVPSGSEVLLHPLGTGYANFELLLAGADMDGAWLVWSVPDDPSATERNKIFGSRLDLASMSIRPSVLLHSPDPPDGTYLIPSALRTRDSHSFFLSWQRAEQPLIFPDPCSFGLAARAAIFEIEGAPLEVPALSRQGAGMLGFLLALFALLRLGRT